MDAYWQNQISPFTGGIRTIGSALAARPVLRAQQQRQQVIADAEAERMQAQTEQAGANTSLLKAKTERENISNQALKGLGDLVSKGLITSDAEGNLVVDKSLANQTAGFVMAQAKGANDAGQGLGNLLSGLNRPNQARLERSNKAAMNDADNASVNARPQHVSPGGALYQNGKVVYQNPSAAAQEQAYETTVQEYPEVEPQEKIIKPEVKHWIGANEPAVTETIPGTPARKVTRRIPLATAAQPRGGETNAPALNQPAVNIPAGAIQKLKANPQLKADFEAKYGAGTAAQFLQ